MFVMFTTLFHEEKDFEIRPLSVLMLATHLLRKGTYVYKEALCLYGC